MMRTNGILIAVAAAALSAAAPVLVMAQDAPASPAQEQKFLAVLKSDAPLFEKAIGMAYVPADVTEPGTPIWIEIRGRKARAELVPTPFYSRKKKKKS